MAKEGETSNVKAWLIVLIALLDDIGALVLVFIVLWFFDIEVSLATMIVIGLVVGTLIFIIHRAVVPSLRRKKVTGAEGMIGMVGEVTEPLMTDGVVRVHGEYWRAKSLDGDIEAGEEVEVVRIDRLNLEVKRKAT